MSDHKLADALHIAVCQAAHLLNASPEVARSKEGREARDILRQALVDYADSVMNAPVTESEYKAIHRGHRK